MNYIAAGHSSDTLGVECTWSGISKEWNAPGVELTRSGIHLELYRPVVEPPEEAPLGGYYKR